MSNSEAMLTMNHVSNQDIMKIAENTDKIGETSIERREDINGDYEELISDISDNEDDTNKSGDNSINISGVDKLEGGVENPIVLNDNDNDKVNLVEYISGSEASDSDRELDKEDLREEIIITDTEQGEVDVNKEEDVEEIDDEIVEEEYNDQREDIDVKNAEIEIENDDTNNGISRDDDKSVVERGEFDISDDDIENLEELEGEKNQANKIEIELDTALDNIGKKIIVKDENQKSKLTYESDEFGSLPIILKIYDTEFLLVPFEGVSSLDLSELVELYDDNEVLNLSIGGFFNSIRTNEDICDCFKLESSKELLLSASQLENVCISEDNIYTKDIKVKDLVLAVNSLANHTEDKSLIPSQITLNLLSQRRFIYDFNLISESIRLKRGFEYFRDSKISRGVKHFLENEVDSEKIHKKMKNN